MICHLFHKKEERRPKLIQIKKLRIQRNQMMNLKILHSLNTIVVEEAEERLIKKLKTQTHMKVNQEEENQCHLNRSRKLKKIKCFNQNRTSMLLKTRTKTIHNSNQLANHKIQNQSPKKLIKVMTMKWDQTKDMKFN